MSDFFTVIDLEKLADKLEGLGFVRDQNEQSTSKPERGRADRAAPNDWPDDEPDGADPWANDEPKQERRTQTRSAPSKGSSSRGRKSQSRPARGGGNSVSQVTQDWPDDGAETDRFDRTWTFGEPDAPECKHGYAAAMLEGESQAGKEYRVWACPAGFGKNYKKKCDLWEYVD